MSLRIRAATKQDRDDIRGIYFEAFPEGENHLIAKLAGNLLNEESDPATVSLIAKSGNEAVGHVAFSPVFSVVSKKCLGFILAPLAVKPTHQNAGIGSKLVEAGIERLSEMGVHLFVVYGDPQYYGRFGFSAEAASRFMPPYELKFPFGWLAILRSQGGANDKVVKLSCVESLHNPALW
ncbi:MAG: N-acetyltransferase [Gammaproteobacteria bacterium]|nr:N-acetyltransferase [Gammaproteobacteria bacterium]